MGIGQSWPGERREKLVGYGYKENAPDKGPDLTKSPTLQQRIDSFNASRIDALAKSRLVGVTRQARALKAQQKAEEAGRLAALADAEADAAKKRARAFQIGCRLNTTRGNQTTSGGSTEKKWTI